MPFLLPLVFPVRAPPKRELSDTTKKVYKSKLNALSAMGFDSVKRIQDEPEEVIKAIKEITGDGDTEKDRHTRRTILSAIFWVAEMPVKNAYHTYWQKCIPFVNDTNGDTWVKKSKL
jgi:hypothetical protein